MRNRLLVLILIAAIMLTAGCLGQKKQPPADTADDPVAVQAEPVFDQAANVYRLAPVPAPTGTATAWAEVDKSYEEGLSPFKVTYRATLGSVDLTTEAVYPTAEEITGIVWVDATTVLLGGRWLADLSGNGELIPLPDYGWSHQLSPDRTKIAFWGRTNPADPNDASMGPQIYDLATGNVSVIKTFTSEDWGFEGEIGIMPRVAWLDGNTLLFDGPRPGMTSVFSHDFTTGKTELWREDGWHVFAAGNGKYAALAHANAKGDYATFVVDLQSGTETELTDAKYAYPTDIVWRGDTIVAYNPDSVGIGRMENGRPVFGQSAGRRVIDVRATDSGVSFVDVSIGDGQITGMKLVTLPAPAK